MSYSREELAADIKKLNQLKMKLYENMLNDRERSREDEQRLVSDILRPAGGIQVDEPEHYQQWGLQTRQPDVNKLVSAVDELVGRLHTAPPQRAHVRGLIEMLENLDEVQRLGVRMRESRVPADRAQGVTLREQSERAVDLAIDIVRATPSPAAHGDARALSASLKGTTAYSECASDRTLLHSNPREYDRRLAAAHHQATAPVADKKGGKWDNYKVGLAAVVLLAAVVAVGVLTHGIGVPFLLGVMSAYANGGGGGSGPEKKSQQQQTQGSSQEQELVEPRRRGSP